jgi:hypothetical protein
MRRVKMVGDGTLDGWRAFDVENGEEVSIDVDWSIDTDDNATATFNDTIVGWMVWRL